MASRAITLAAKEIKRSVREPATLLLIILFPLVLAVMFGTAFGGSPGQNVHYSIAVVDSDRSAWSERLMQNMGGMGILTVSQNDNATAQDDLSQGKLQAVLLIPDGFGVSCQSLQDNGTVLTFLLPIYLDRGSMVATQAIPPVVGQVLKDTIQPNSTSAIPISLAAASVETSQINSFDLMAPGIFAYASIFLTMTVAQSFTVDREKGLLKRIAMTPTSPAEFIIGQVLANMAIAALQVFVLFSVMFVIGYHPAVGAGAIMLGAVLLLVFSLCNVGFGLITATLARSPGAATGIAFIFIMPQMMLGTFVGSALSSTAQQAGRFVPSYYVTDALTSLWTRGAPADSASVIFDLLMVIAISVVVLMAGIMVFRRYGKS
ncbi:MAG: ABC transporter permease [Methanomassiliicoccales archaeon]|jgi:ABC-2 type transport system permease protein